MMRLVLAHIAGLPVDELLLPLASGGGLMLLAARTALAARLRRRR